MSIIRFYRLILDITAIILLILIYLYILSGYGLVKTSVVRKYTGRLLTRGTSVFLHLNPVLRIVLIITTALHGITGFTILSYRIRSSNYRLGIIIAVHLAVIGLTMLLLLIEFS